MAATRVATRRRVRSNLCRAPPAATSRRNLRTHRCRSAHATGTAADQRQPPPRRADAARAAPPRHRSPPPRPRPQPATPARRGGGGGGGATNRPRQHELVVAEPHAYRQPRSQPLVITHVRVKRHRHLSRLELDKGARRRRRPRQALRRQQHRTARRHGWRGVPSTAVEPHAVPCQLPAQPQPRSAQKVEGRAKQHAACWLRLGDERPLHVTHLFHCGVRRTVGEDKAVDAKLLVVGLVAKVAAIGPAPRAI
eukprot:scaffold28108_cov61-Phaeocystis_antarctica.AAC.6